MLRRHFITGEENPDFIITYYAPEHIPFCNGYKDELTAVKQDITNTENDIKIKCILDSWDNGVGEYGFKILNNPNKLWTGTWSSNDIVGSIGWAVDVNTLNPLYDFSNSITLIILPKEIKHLDDDLICDHVDPFNVSVEYVTLPENLETLGNNVLRALRVLKKIIIPDTVNSIGNSALEITSSYNVINVPFPGNISLEEIILKPFNPPETYADPFGAYDPVAGYVNPNLKIRVYADCIDKYKNDSVWGQYNDLYDTINNAIVCYTDEGKRNIYERNDDIYEIKENDISNYSSRIYLPNTTYFIRKNALQHFHNLTEISMPAVTIIEKYAFYNNRKLTTINMPHISEIGEDAFNQCSSLSSIIIPNSVTSIGDNAFYNCSSLKFITLPENLSQIGTNAFYNCRFGKNNIICDYDKLRSVGAHIYDIENEDGGFINHNDDYNDKVFIGWRLTSDIITIPEDIKYLNSYLSYGDLNELNISKNVISFFAIYYRDDNSNGDKTSNIRLFDSIRTINIDKDNPIYDSRDNCNAIIETATNTLVAGSIGTTIPNGVKIIKSNAFISQKIVNSLNTNDVEIIENMAFNECNFDIESFTVSKNTISIGYVYYGDNNHIKKLIVDKDNPKYKDYNNTMIVEKDTNTLIWSTTFNIPEGIVNIADFPFLYRLYGNPIYIPKSVISIGSHLFGMHPNKREVIYAGTINEWNNIEKSEFWYRTNGDNEGDTIIHCTDGDIVIK